MENKKDEILILGMGNDILTDDGIGIRLSQELEKIITHPKISFDTLNIGGLEIIEFLMPYETVIILDAIKTLNGVPGDVYHFIPADFKATSHLDNLHDISFLNALEVGKKLGIHVPSNIQIVAVEIVEDMEFGSDFTPQVQARWEEIKTDVKEIVFELLSEQNIKIS